MAYTPLFHEVHTDLFRALGNCLHRLWQGEELTRQDILDSLPQVDWSSLQEYHKMLDALFLFDEKGMAVPFIKSPFAPAPTNRELDWLADFLHAPEAGFLLSAGLREKLQAMLQDYGEHTEKDLLIIRDQNAPPPVAELSLIWQSLLEERQLNYTNTDRLGQVHQGTCSPCRLEYDAAAHHYRLIAWLEDEDRAIKLNVERLSALSLGSPLPQGCRAKLEKFLAVKRRSCLIRLKPRYNAAERAFKLLATYDKEAIYDEEADIYQLKLYYYEFDQQEVLEKILSLGAAAEVLEPAVLREEIKDILEKHGKTS